MQRIYQAAALVVLAVSIWVVVESRTNLIYYTRFGPGSGFFTFWLGLVLALLSLIWFLQVTFQPVEPRAKDFIPERMRLIHIAAVILAVAGFAAFAETFGFVLAIFTFLVVVLSILGRSNPVVTVAISLAISWGLSYAFREFLQVPLPSAGIEFLHNLGL